MKSIGLILLPVFWLSFTFADVAYLPFKKHPDSCETAKAKKNGIYKIQVNGGEIMNVYCDVSLTGSPWLVIQRRKNGDTNFYRNWSAYQRGFGKLKAEYFIGLDKLHSLTVSEPQELYVYLEDFEGQTRFAKYDEFLIGNEATQYTMHKLGNFSGNTEDSLRYHLDMKFTTFDRDNDTNEKENCAVKYTGAWWYQDCQYSNLNGLYLGGKYETDQFARGITWCEWKGYYYSLKTVQMMIRPKKV